ncbi:hypothetical protein BZM27_44420, partial [Paraburkholderia steynii]
AARVAALFGRASAARWRSSSMRAAALSQRLNDGALDVLVGDPAMVDATPLVNWSQPLFWVGARGYLADPQSPLPLVAFGGACLWQQQVMTVLRRAGIAWPGGVCTSTSLPAVQSAVEAGLGVSVLLDGNIRYDTMLVLAPPTACRSRPPPTSACSCGRRRARRRPPSTHCGPSSAKRSISTSSSARLERHAGDRRRAA